MSGLTGAAIGYAGQTLVYTQHGLNKKREALAKQIMQKIPQHDTKMSYEHKQEGIDFHYIVENKFVYLVVNVREDENRMTKRIPFTYLDDIKEKFKDKFGGGKYPDHNSLGDSQCKAFDSVLKDRMEFCNDKDKVKAIEKQINEVKDIMVENLDNLLERGEKIDTLVEKTETMDVEVCAVRVLWSSLNFCWFFFSLRHRRRTSGTDPRS